jgi:hypothetical protein
VLLLLASSWAAAEGAWVWSVDNGASSNFLSTSALADDSAVTGSATDADNVSGSNTLFVGFPVDGILADLARRSDAIAPQGDMETRGTTFVAIRGVEETVLTVDWKALSATQMDASRHHSGWASAGMSSLLRGTVSGLVPGQTYVVRYDWLYEADGETEHETTELPLDDIQFARGSLDLSVAGVSAEGDQRIFDIEVDGDDPQLPDITSDADTGSFAFQAPAETVEWVLDFAGDSYAQLQSPPEGDDAATSLFRGQIVIEIIPEPATLMVTIPALVLSRRGRRRESVA